MGKKRLDRLRRDHEAEVRRERAMQQRLRLRRENSTVKGTSKPRRRKREVLRYRRHMRIGGVIATNKKHAKELFRQKLQKRPREMEWEAPEESRPKKKRLVENTQYRYTAATLTDGPQRFDHLNLH